MVEKKIGCLCNLDNSIMCHQPKQLVTVMFWLFFSPLKLQLIENHTVMGEMSPSVWMSKMKAMPTFFLFFFFFYLLVFTCLAVTSLQLKRNIWKALWIIAARCGWHFPRTKLPSSSCHPWLLVKVCLNYGKFDPVFPTAEETAFIFRGSKPIMAKRGLQ